MKLLIQIILLIIIGRYLWKVLKKYIPKIENRDDLYRPKKTESEIKIDKSNIEDAKFTEINEDKEK